MDFVFEHAGKGGVPTNTRVEVDRLGNAVTWPLAEPDVEAVLEKFSTAS
jgi:hypothetical protein